MIKVLGGDLIKYNPTSSDSNVMFTMNHDRQFGQATRTQAQHVIYENQYLVNGGLQSNRVFTYNAGETTKDNMYDQVSLRATNYFTIRIIKPNYSDDILTLNFYSHLIQNNNWAEYPYLLDSTTNNDRDLKLKIYVNFRFSYANTDEDCSRNIHQLNVNFIFNKDTTTESVTKTITNVKQGDIYYMVLNNV